MENWRQELANGAANAKLFEGGNFFTDGEYASLIIDKLIMKKGQKGVCFVGEFLVEQSTPDASAPAGIKPNAPGTRASVVYNVTKHEAAMSNIKALMLAVSGYTEQQLIADQEAENAKAQAEQRDAISIFSAAILKVTNENESEGTVQPLRGRRIAGSTYRKGTGAQTAQGLPREKWNCYIKFRSVEGQTAATQADGLSKLAAMVVPQAPAAPPAPTPPAPPPATQFGAIPPAPPAGPPPGVAAPAEAPPAVPPTPATAVAPSSPAPAGTGFLSALGV